MSGLGNAVSAVRVMSPLLKSSQPAYVDMNSDADIVTRLKFIAKIGRNEKINTYHMFIQPDDIMTKLSRTFWNKDTRSRAEQFILSTVHRAMSIIEHYVDLHSRLADPNERDLCMSTFRNLILDLDNSRKGIYNLKDTYATDQNFECKMESVLQLIEAKLGIYNKVLSEVAGDDSREVTVVTPASTSPPSSSPFE